jgi:hypothetical protein
MDGRLLQIDTSAGIHGGCRHRPNQPIVPGFLWFHPRGRGRLPVFFIPWSVYSLGDSSRLQMTVLIQASKQVERPPKLAAIDLPHPSPRAPSRHARTCIRLWGKPGSGTPCTKLFLCSTLLHEDASGCPQGRSKCTIPANLQSLSGILFFPRSVLKTWGATLHAHGTQVRTVPTHTTWLRSCLTHRSSPIVWAPALASTRSSTDDQLESQSPISRRWLCDSGGSQWCCILLRARQQPACSRLQPPCLE